MCTELRRCEVTLYTQALTCIHLCLSKISSFPAFFSLFFDQTNSWQNENTGPQRQLNCGGLGWNSKVVRAHLKMPEPNRWQLAFSNRFACCDSWKVEQKNCGSQHEGVPRVRHPQEDEGASSVGDHPYCQATEKEDPRGGGRGHPYHSVALLPQPRAHHQEVTQKAHPQPEDGLCWGVQEKNHVCGQVILNSGLAARVRSAGGSLGWTGLIPSSPRGQ